MRVDTLYMMREMNILLYAQLRGLSCNIATGVVHRTEKNLTGIISCVGKRDLQGKFKTTELIFAVETESDIA